MSMGTRIDVGIALFTITSNFCFALSATHPIIPLWCNVAFVGLGTLILGFHLGRWAQKNEDEEGSPW